MKKLILPISIVLSVLIGFLVGKCFNSNKYELIHFYNHDKNTYYWDVLLLINKQTGEIKEITNYGGNSVKNGDVIYKP